MAEPTETGDVMPEAAEGAATADGSPSNGADATADGSPADEAETAAGEAKDAQGDPGDSVVEPSPEELDPLAAQVADLKDRLARARADYDNLQKRVARDSALEQERAKARAIEAFLQVYEFAQMAGHEAQRNPGPLAQGVKMLVTEFERVLQSQGVSPIGQAGEPFDPAVHDAVATEATDGTEPGHVSRVITPGYRLGMRVLRHARVAVQPEDDTEE